jgi:hypothetical protein
MMNPQNQGAGDTPNGCGRSEVLVHGERPARWEPQEESMMSISVDFPSVKKLRFIILGEEQTMTTEGDADWLNNTPTRAPFNDTC